MFAYVKFCPPDNSLSIVKTCQIAKFKIPFDKTKKYKVACDDNEVKKAVVIYAEDTEEKLQQTIDTQRTKFPPVSQQVSATEESDVDIIKNNRGKETEAGDSSIQSVLQLKLASKEKELMVMDQQQAIELDKENDSSAANSSEMNEPFINFEPVEVTLSTSRKNDQLTKVLKNSTLGERFREQLKHLNEGSSDGNLDVDGTDSSKISKHDAESSLKSSNLKRSLIGRGKSSKKSKKRKVSDGNNKSEMNQKVVTPATIHSNADHRKSIAESEAQLALFRSSPLDNNNSQVETVGSNSKKGKKSRKAKDKELNYDAIMKILTKISDDVDWLKEHHDGLESFIIENLTANLENWNQVKNVKQAPSNNSNLTIEDINRPPEVGYVRIDNNMIHLGHNIWLPKQSYDDAVYNATTNSMFVKNIAMAVFGPQYLKEHSVKGKSCNKTKSVPRPAIDPTKALAIRDIFEYYLKTNKQLIGSNLLSERDTYEDHIRAKISDLLRPPKNSKPKVPKVPPKPKESSSSSCSSESSAGSEDEKDAEEETQKEEMQQNEEMQQKET